MKIDEIHLESIGLCLDTNGAFDMSGVPKGLRVNKAETGPLKFILNDDDGCKWFDSYKIEKGN